MVSRHAALATVVLFSLVFAACGLTGSGGGESSNESPEWVGNWELTKVNGQQTEGETTYWDLSEEAFTYITERSDAEGCFTDTDDVLEIDGNVVTTITGNVATSVRHEVSGETLKVTFLDSDREATAKAVDSDPRDLAGCKQ